MTLRKLNQSFGPRALARKVVGRYRKREDGSVAIEFALIAPIMIFMYLGLYQVTMAIMTDRAVSHSTSVLGDLVSQSAVIDKSQVEDALQAAIEVLDISNGEALKNDVSMQIVSLRIDPNTGAPEEIGKAEVGGSWPAINYADIDPRLLSASSGAIVARIRYNFRLLSHGNEAEMKDINRDRYLGSGGLTLAEQFVLKPRVSLDIPFEDGAGNQKANFSCSINSATLEVSC